MPGRHGDLIMVGGYAAFWLATGFGIDPFVALALVIPLTAGLGLTLYQGLFTFVVRLDEETQRHCLPAIGAALRTDEATL